MEALLLAEVADKDSRIRDREFHNAHLLGPAVIAPLRNVAIHRCRFDAEPEALFIEVDDDRTLTGVIGLEDVTFEDCAFKNVAIVGTRASIEKLRAGLNEAAQPAPSAS